MSFQKKSIDEILAQPGPRWDVTVSVKEVDEGENNYRLWVTGLRADVPVDSKRVEMALQFALEMLRNEKWIQRKAPSLFGSTV